MRGSEQEHVTSSVVCSFLAVVMTLYAFTCNGDSP